MVDESEVEAERALKAEVEELRGILAEHDETKKLLRAQLRRLEDETRVARKQRDAQAAVRERQAATLAEIELCVQLYFQSTIFSLMFYFLLMFYSCIHLNSLISPVINAILSLVHVNIILTLANSLFSLVINVSLSPARVNIAKQVQRGSKQGADARRGLEAELDG